MYSVGVVIVVTIKYQETMDVSDISRSLSLGCVLHMFAPTMVTPPAGRVSFQFRNSIA